MRALLPLLLVAPALLGQTVQLSDPSKPATLKATLMTGTLRVVGHAGREVVVEGTAPASEKYPGMRRIGGPVEERDNVVHLRWDPMRPQKGPLVVKLPYGSRVEVKVMSGGPLVIEDVRGPIEAEHMAGDIRIQGVAGAVAATTLAGNLLADLSRLDGPLDLATLSGRLELALPADAKADLKASVQDRHSFHCDLPLREEERGAAKTYGPQSIRGTINGGGTRINLRCLSGGITIKRH